MHIKNGRNDCILLQKNLSKELVSCSATLYSTHFSQLKTSIKQWVEAYKASLKSTNFSLHYFSLRLYRSTRIHPVEKKRHIERINDESRKPPLTYVLKPFDLCNISRRFFLPVFTVIFKASDFVNIYYTYVHSNAFVCVVCKLHFQYLTVGSVCLFVLLPTRFLWFRFRRWH